MSRGKRLIKYNHLVADLLIFPNVVTMSKALRHMEADGHATSDDILAVLSPYQTEHINRFGQYLLNFGRAPEPLPTELRKPPGKESPGFSLANQVSAGN